MNISGGWSHDIKALANAFSPPVRDKFSDLAGR